MELLTGRRVAFGVVAGAAVYTYMQKQKAAKRAKKKAEQGGDGTKKPRKKDAMMEIFNRLWPFSKSKADLEKDPDASVGRMELVLIFLVSVMRTWHQNRMVYIKRDLMEATYKRNTTMFKAVMYETVVLSLVSSGIFAFHRFLKERLAMLWREKLTGQLHRQYFNGMAYYKLSHLNKNQIADVEERITKDPRRFCKALADEMEKMSAAMTAGVWFTYKLTTISSFGYAVSPLIYFYTAFLISQKVAPDWSARWRGMLDRRGKYFASQSRLQSNAEAICAYQGNKQERAIIEDLWDNFTTYCIDYVLDASKFQFVMAALFEYGGHSFAETLIIGKFVNPENSPAKAAVLEAMKTGDASAQLAATASLFSEVRFVTEYFIRAMSAQGIIVAVMRQLQNMRGPAKRITELFGTLDGFEAKRTASTTFIDDKNKVGFHNVQVYTPTGNLLVKDLNFSIDAGTNMLLTGCNGSGKSSLFRCLGALWEVPEGGTITKPGGNASGLNAGVFYLPQKPYNVIGTLADQLAYPLSKAVASKITRKEIERVLNEVDLGYLLERGIGLKEDDEVNWETILSLGEKQRMAMARMFWHGPRFAILDECTSGVSAAMERRLYMACKERGVTCITISHRPVLEQYHDVVVNILADGKGGWEHRKTKSVEEVSTGESEAGGYSAAYYEDLKKVASSKDLTETKMEDERQITRSLHYKEQFELSGTKELKKVDMTQRLSDVMTKFMPNGMTWKDPEFRRILFLGSLVVGKTLLADALARFDGYVLSTVLQTDWGVFARACAGAAFFRTFLAFFDAALLRHKWYLNLEWRRRLTSYVMDLYFKVNTFYDVKNQDGRISDPEERLTEQIEQLSISLTDLWTALLRPTFDIAYNSVMLYRTLGFAGVSYTTGYMVVAAYLMKFVVPNFKELQKAAFKLEGRFRFVHTRLKEHTESVAFFGGDEVEHGLMKKTFGDVCGHARTTVLETLRFNMFNNFLVRQTPDIMAFSLRMYYAMGFIKDSDVMDDSKGTKLSSTGEYIQQTIMRSFSSFGDALELQEMLGNFVGVLENVTDAMYVLEDIAKGQEARLNATGNSGGAVVPSKDGAIRFSNVDIVAPGGLCCASNLSLEVTKGNNVVVTGPNASGKSSLFRVLGGLWPLKAGEIQRPCNASGVVTPKEVFLVPQKPYSVMGTLADQITYPEKIKPEDRTKEEEDHLMSLMTLVRVPYLVSREGGWDAVARWEDVLSLGEQQRIGCARLFYHKPQYAVLDECTSAVSIDVEEALYRAAHEMGITSITISQRLALEEFHNNELRMGNANGDEGWRLHAIGSEGPSALNSSLLNTSASD